MHLKLKKALLFLLIVVLFDSNVLFIKSGFLLSIANAEEGKTIEVHAPKVDPGGATFPECGSDVALGLAALIAGALVGVGIAITGVGARVFMGSVCIDIPCV